MFKALFLCFIFSLSLVSAIDVLDNSDVVGVNIIEPGLPGFNNNTAFVNATEFWITVEGVLDNVVDISHNWFNPTSLLWSNAGHTIDTDMEFNNNSIINLSSITFNDYIFFGDVDHFLRRGATNFNGLATNAFSFQQEDEHPEGTIPFVVSANKTNSDTDAILIMAQIGLNESNSVLGNSWIIVVNNLTNNLTEYSECFLVAGLLNKTLRVQCDSEDTGADLIVQDDIQSFGTMFADGGIRAETLVDFIMNGEDVSIQNGGLHIFTPVTFERGVIEGEVISKFDEDFTGGLGSFVNLQSDLGNWFATSNILCDEGDCANAIGISGLGNIIMEANISTININSSSLNFIYSLTNILGSNDFEVTVNNNVGSGEVSIFTDSTNNVILSSQSINLPESMSNQPKVSIRFNCDVTNTNRQCFVDTINVNGSAIATTLTNLSGFNSVIKFGDGTLAADGFPERGIIYNASADITIIRGNVSFQNILEQDLNVTNSITLRGETIFDWDNVSSFDDNVLLVDGSRIATNLNISGIIFMDTINSILGLGFNFNDDINTTGLIQALSGLIQDSVNGGDVSMTIGNSDPTFSLDETASLIFLHQNAIAAKIVATKEGDYSSSEEAKSGIDFYTLGEGSLVRELTLQWDGDLEGYTNKLFFGSGDIDNSFEVGDSSTDTFKVNTGDANVIFQDFEGGGDTHAIEIVFTSSMIAGIGLIQDSLGFMVDGGIKWIAGSGSDEGGIEYIGDNIEYDSPGSGQHKFIDDINATGNLYADKIAIGSNTIAGLSSGDGNVSILFYDTLSPKSPSFICPESTDWCSIDFPNHQENIYIQKDSDWKIINVSFKGDYYTKQEFSNNICTINEKTQIMCDELTEKIIRKKAKIQSDIILEAQRLAIKQAEETCRLNNNSWDGECYQMVKQIKTHSEAVEIIQIYKTEIIETMVTELDMELKEYTYLKNITIETRETESVGKFVEGCGWSGNYYCMERVLI